MHWEFKIGTFKIKDRGNNQTTKSFYYILLKIHIETTYFLIVSTSSTHSV